MRPDSKLGLYVTLLLICEPGGRGGGKLGLIVKLFIKVVVSIARGTRVGEISHTKWVVQL